MIIGCHENNIPSLIQDLRMYKKENNYKNGITNMMHISKFSPSLVCFNLKHPPVITDEISLGLEWYWHNWSINSTNLTNNC